MVDIPWGSPEAHKFVANVGLITSDGPHGPNVMACEWTRLVSYEPGLVAVFIHREYATFENVEKTKEFGVSIASNTQNIASSIAGGSHGNEVDKVAVLKDLGVEFYKAKTIKTLMVRGAVLNIECKLSKIMDLGDHVVLIGEAQDVQLHEEEPIIYHAGKYYKLGERVQKPSTEELARIGALREKYRKTKG